MIIQLSAKERAEMLIAWKTGKLDTSKIERLKHFDPPRRLTAKEAAEILTHLNDEY